MIAAIQAAINVAAALRGGGVVTFAPDIHLISSPFIAQPYTRLIGGYGDYKFDRHGLNNDKSP